MKKFCMLLSLITILCLLGCPQGTGGSDNPTINTDKKGLVTITIQDDQKGYVEGSSSGLLVNKTDKNSSNGTFWESFQNPWQINYCVNTDTAGNYTLTVRYAFGGTVTNLRDAIISVNGNRVSIPESANNNLEFEYTQKFWTEWADSSCTIPLVAGNNFISIKADIGKQRNITVNNSTQLGTVVGLPNIDYISIKSTVPNVKLAAGESANVAYYSVVTKCDETKGSVISSVETADVKGGTVVTLEAKPATGYYFLAWEGSHSGTENPCTITVNENVSLKALFYKEGTTQPAGLIGFGTVLDDNGTPYIITGGEGGEEITVTNLNELEAALTKTEPAIVKIENLITTVDANGKAIDKSATIAAKSNKTIISETGNGHIKNIEIKLNGENYIVKNMTFSECIAIDYFAGSGNDSLKVGGGKYVWIDHCEFFSKLEPTHNDGSEITEEEREILAGYAEKGEVEKDYYDGLLDITNGAAFITVSNCYFHDHQKAILCGSGDGADDAKYDVNIRVTFYNNYFKDIGSRIPMIRYGKAHVFNNYYLNEQIPYGDSSAINCRSNSELLIEYNKFVNYRRALGYYFDTSYPTGKANVRGNDYGSADEYTVATTTWEPGYSWTVEKDLTKLAETIPTTAGVIKN
ncbi:MAG: hypothetical protein E7062_06780 [Spirochaetaceae bacterium]|nr:hypothetical protein [Spirochaetaceae bacterium]